MTVCIILAITFACLVGLAVGIVIGLRIAQRKARAFFVSKLRTRDKRILRFLGLEK